MKRLLVLALSLFAASVEAGNSTLVFTSPQSTNIQTTLIPEANRRKCLQYGGLPGTCTSAQLVTNGCVVRTARSLQVEGCAIFTQDAAGEQAFLQERMNRALVELIRVLQPADPADYCFAWTQLDQTERDRTCTEVLRMPAPCTPCQ